MEEIKLDLGGGYAPAPNHINIDITDNADIKWDLNKGLPTVLKFDKKGVTIDRKKFINNVYGIRCSHVIEHLDSIIPLLNDCFIAMKSGSIMEISTPLAGTDQWYQDPTHKRAYIPQTFLYFSKDSPYKKEQDEYGIIARFEILKAETGEGTDNWQLFVVLKKP